MKDTFVTTDGVRLAYCIDDYTDPWKPPATLVMLHSAMSSARRFYSMVPGLAKHYRVVRLDSRGHGESQVPSPELPHDKWRLNKDVLELFDKLGIERAHILGGSAGGYTAQLLEDNWPKSGNRTVKMESQAAGAMLERVREAIRALTPVDAGQRWLQEQALQINVSLLRQRWLLIERDGGSVQPIVVVILVSWISLIFASFGLNAPRNGTVVIAFLVCSLAIGGAFFLVLEMDDPLAGALKISSAPMARALANMLP